MVYSGIRFTGSAKAHSIFASGLLHQFFTHVLTDTDENQQRQDTCPKVAQQRRCRFLHLFCKYRAGAVNRCIILVSKHDFGVIDLYLADVFFR